MTRGLPSLEEPTRPCPDCGYPLTFEAPDWCPVCEAVAMDDLAEREQKRLAAIRAQLAEARRRARTWQLGRVAS